MRTDRRRSYQGRDTGPVQQVGEVVDRRRVGDYWGITITAGEVARRARPGQFVNVEVTASGTLLRRPFSVAGASATGPVAGTIDIVVDAHGPGTDALGRCRTGDRMTVMGPLGRPFPMPQRRVSALLVGGGYGAAPLYWLGDRLRAAGHRIGFVVGATDQPRLLDPIVAKRMATHTTFTTEDGSMGHQGRVTDVLDDALVATGAEVVYTCGPNGMLAAVSRICERRDIPCQVAVEEHMACGIGVCMTCVLEIHTRTGDIERRRVCVDGPVFSSTRVAWDHSRYAVGPSAGSAPPIGAVYEGGAVSTPSRPTPGGAAASGDASVDRDATQPARAGRRDVGRDGALDPERPGHGDIGSPDAATRGVVPADAGSADVGPQGLASADTGHEVDAREAAQDDDGLLWTDGTGEPA